MKAFILAFAMLLPFISIASQMRPTFNSGIVYCWLEAKGTGEASLHQAPTGMNGEEYFYGEFKRSAARSGKKAWCHGVRAIDAKTFTFYRVEGISKNKITIDSHCHMVGDDVHIRTQTAKLSLDGQRHHIFRMNDDYTYGSNLGYDMLVYIATEDELDFGTRWKNLEDTCRELANLYHR